MGSQRMQNQDLGLVLSPNAKPRLKWTAELHQRFIKAVTQLGGAEKATPKTLMRVMGVPGLTLYHLKSHLQKYRLGKNIQSDTCSDNKHADHGETEIRSDNIGPEIVFGVHTKMNERLQIAQALQMQMEVQKKLQEQMEVQRHLQLRIEAQGKYLQSVLKRAQETLTGYKSSAMVLEATKMKLSQIVTMVDTQSSDSSRLETETGDLSLRKVRKRLPEGTDCSMDSSLTSSDSSERKDEKREKLERKDSHEYNIISDVPPLMEIEGNLCKTVSNNKLGDKRTWVNQPPTTTTPSTHRKKPSSQSKNLRLSEELDLNSQYQSEIDSGHQELDLNSEGTETL